MNTYGLSSAPFRCRDAVGTPTSAGPGPVNRRQFADCSRGVCLAGDGGNDIDERDGGAGDCRVYGECLCRFSREDDPIALWAGAMNTQFSQSLETRCDRLGTLGLQSLFAVTHTGVMPDFLTCRNRPEAADHP